MAAKMSYYIDAPVESVFDFFKDPSNQVDSPPFSDMKVHDAKMTKEGVGTHYSWSVKMAGVPVKGFEIFTDFCPTSTSPRGPRTRWWAPGSTGSNQRDRARG